MPVRKFIWPLALVLVIAVLAGGGVWLSQRETDGLKAGTLVSETADGKEAGHGASLVGVQVARDGPEDLLAADRLLVGQRPYVAGLGWGLRVSSRSARSSPARPR